MQTLSHSDAPAQAEARVGKIPGSGTIHHASWNGDRYVVDCGVRGATIWSSGDHLVSCGRGAAGRCRMSTPVHCIECGVVLADHDVYYGWLCRRTLCPNCCPAHECSGNCVE
jgi:hypothetical protein